MKLEVHHSEKNILWLADEDTLVTVCDFYPFENAKQNAHDLAHRYNVHDELVEAIGMVSSMIALDVLNVRQRDRESFAHIWSQVADIIAKAKGAGDE